MTHHRLLWPTLITAAGVALLLTLGSWQVERLRWKEALISARNTALAAQPSALPAQLTDIVDLEFRRVVVRGRFLHAKELYVLNRTHKSVVGVHVITPLQRRAIDGGGVVLINRGWVPHDRQKASTRPDGQVSGDVKITGIVRLGVTARGKFTPANDAARGHWYAPAPLAMAQAVKVDAPDLIVEAGGAANRGGLPIGGQTLTTLVNNHLSYALTWFGLALALIVVYLVYVFRRPRSSSEKEIG